ncbi:hypothetical protein SARC_10285, partial [Sphaeroforma arctica JP610]
TGVGRRTLSPVWNADFRFELGDEELQDESLEIKVYDYDTISANDAIGKVYVSLNPLLTWDPPSQLSGWYPIYDTIRGIRGEVSIVIKLDLFNNTNQFRDTSVGVQIFSLSVLPECYKTLAIHGFVEELVVDNDPEYHWADSFRTSRSSNEARQRQFMKLSNELQRKVGLKVLELGGNAVVGYQQSFDIEQEYGLVVRGIGTAVTLAQPLSQAVTGAQVRHSTASFDGSLSPPTNLKRRGTNDGSDPVIGTTFSGILGVKSQSMNRKLKSKRSTSSELSDSDNTEEMNTKLSNTSKNRGIVENSAVKELRSHDALVESASFEETANLTGAAVPGTEHGEHQAHRLRPEEPAARSSTVEGGSDAVSKSGISDAVVPHSEKSSAALQPTVKVFTGGDIVRGQPKGQTAVYLIPRKIHVQLQDVILLTLISLPSAVNIRMGGVVSARSVKLLDTIKQRDGSETRDSWWMEVREEIKSHATSMGCNVVLAYREVSSIHDELFILSASGTACVMDSDILTNFALVDTDGAQVPMRQSEKDKEKDKGKAGAESPKHVPELSLDETHVTNQGTPQVRPQSNTPTQNPVTPKPLKRRAIKSCQFLHIPYRRRELPFPLQLFRCNICGKRSVPEFLVCTSEMPPEADVLGTGDLIEARVCRVKKKEKPEYTAVAISEALPFLEYDLHTQLLNKLKVKGMNAIFGLRMELSVGDGLIIAMAAGTAVYLQALPAPPAIQIERTLEIIDDEDKKLNHIAKQIMLVSEMNRENLRKASAAPASFVEGTESRQATYTPKVEDIAELSTTRTNMNENAGVDRYEVGRRTASARESFVLGGEARRGHESSIKSEFASEETLVHPLQLLNSPNRANGPDVGDIATPPTGRHLSAPVTTAHRQPVRSTTVSLPTKEGSGADTNSKGKAKAIAESDKEWAMHEAINDAAEELDTRTANGSTLYNDDVIDTSSSSSSSDNTTSDEDEDGAPTVTGTVRGLTVVEVDDETDEDSMGVLLEPPMPHDIWMCTTQEVPGFLKDFETFSLNSVTALRRLVLDSQSEKHLNMRLASICNSLLHGVCFKLRHMTPCCMAKLSYDVRISEEVDDAVQVCLSAAVLGMRPIKSPAQGVEDDNTSKISVNRSDSYHTKHSVTNTPQTNISLNDAFSSVMPALDQRQVDNFVEISGLNHIPGTSIVRYSGRLNVVFIKESTSIREDNGISAFVHKFIAEAHGCVRAYVRAMGGNALLACQQTELNITDSPHKDKGYVLMTISGDIFQVEHDANVPHPYECGITVV